MKRLLTITTAALVLVPAATAKTNPQTAALQKRVANLETMIVQLQTQLKLESNRRVCTEALDQDSLRIAFTTLSKLAAAVIGQNVPAWESIPRFDDGGSCAVIGVTRP